VGEGEAMPVRVIETDAANRRIVLTNTGPLTRREAPAVVEPSEPSEPSAATERSESAESPERSSGSAPAVSEELVVDAVVEAAAAAEPPAGEEAAAGSGSSGETAAAGEATAVGSEDRGDADAIGSEVDRS
jgi:hypothetical protein